jgi:cell division GTPase FtsZ
MSTKFKIINIFIGGYGAEILNQYVCTGALDKLVKASQSFVFIDSNIVDATKFKFINNENIDCIFTSKGLQGFGGDAEQAESKFSLIEDNILKTCEDAGCVIINAGLARGGTGRGLTPLIADMLFTKLELPVLINSTSLQLKEETEENEKDFEKLINDLSKKYLINITNTRYINTENGSGSVSNIFKKLANKSINQSLSLVSLLTSGCDLGDFQKKVFSNHGYFLLKTVKGETFKMCLDSILDNKEDYFTSKIYDCTNYLAAAQFPVISSNDEADLIKKIKRNSNQSEPKIKLVENKTSNSLTIFLSGLNAVVKSQHGEVEEIIDLSLLDCLLDNDLVKEETPFPSSAVDFIKNNLQELITLVNEGKSYNSIAMYFTSIVEKNQGGYKIHPTQIEREFNKNNQLITISLTENEQELNTIKQEFNNNTQN